MRVRLWGVRGSLPTPISAAQLRAKTHALLAEATPADLASSEAIDRYLDHSPHSWTYGGNTSCVEIAFGDQLFVLDAGSGISSLGRAIKADGRDRTAKLNLFFTHFHWDHICGLPFFKPLFMPGRRIDVWSGRSDAGKLLENQMSGPHFPAKWKNLQSEISFHQIFPGKGAKVAGADVQIMPMIHADRAFGYRVGFGGRSVCYLTDTEVSKNSYGLAPMYSKFVSGADVVIVDAMYGFLEYHDNINFGHSTIYNFIDFFKDTEIGELVIFHHDPAATDPNITQLLHEAIRYKSVIAPQARWALSAAFEGKTWELVPHSGSPGTVKRRRAAAGTASARKSRQRRP